MDPENNKHYISLGYVYIQRKQCKTYEIPKTQKPVSEEISCLHSEAK